MYTYEKQSIGSQQVQCKFLVSCPACNENECRWAQTNKHQAKNTCTADRKNDHMMHMTYKKEDMHVMPTNLPHKLGNSTELKQASSWAELLSASYSQRQPLCSKMRSILNAVRGLY